jgi:hypothetical protein
MDNRAEHRALMASLWRLNPYRATYLRNLATSAAFADSSFLSIDATQYYILFHQV